MKYIADLHIHSHFSRATSKNLIPEQLYIWAQRKGLRVIATGDISHPQWLAEMQEKLEPAADAPGLYVLKSSLRPALQKEIPHACQSDVYFILSGEISNIYKRDGAVRKVHNVVFFPSLESVAHFQSRLDRIGNIRSDGRPILGLDSRNLLEIVLETDAAGALIPAHIWTPWFSMLGSQSGFDSVQACYADLTPHIFALETGLSSDPAMNWRLSQLDRYNLVSNSDAHSAENLAREANVFNTDLSYNGLFDSLKHKENDGFWGTLEFFPEEGKYHMDGHRKCNSMTKPAETIRNKGLCPVCGKPAVLGVSYRVEELADRPEGFHPETAKRFASLVPLPEVLGEVFNVGPTSKKVKALYETLLHALGSELAILLDYDLADIDKAGGPLVAEAIRRMRNAEVDAQPGYDGEYGIIRLFKENEREAILQQAALFAAPTSEQAPLPQPEKKKQPGRPKKEAERIKEPVSEYGLNPEQQLAVTQKNSPLIIQAGPGTGKTRTLSHWLAERIKTVAPERTLAITFTNKAAVELNERLHQQLQTDADRITISTFHAFGLSILRASATFFDRRAGFTIIDPNSDHTFQSLWFSQCATRPTKAVLERISLCKGQMYYPDNLSEELLQQSGTDFIEQYRAYEKTLIRLNSVDMDDLIALTVRLLRFDPDLRRALLNRYDVLAVDEFQDINQAQYELFLLFALSAKWVCAIGDPDQAIYGFRGSSSRFFEQIQADIPSCAYLKLTRNYRSTQNILDASRQMLSKDHAIDRSELFSGIDAEVKIIQHQALTDRAEAEFIVKEIEILLGGTSHFSVDSDRVDRQSRAADYAFADIAILIRSKLLLPPLAEALSRAGIPYESVHEQRLSDTTVVPYISAGIALYHDRTVHALARLLPFFAAEIPLPQLTRLLQTDWTRNDFPSAAAVMRFLDFYQQLTALPPAATCVQLLGFLREQQPFADEESASLYKTLARTATPFADRYQAFVDHLLLCKSVDDWDERADRVHILTLHAAKGLEFPVVFIPGCEETILPFSLGNLISDPEEERRLLYVGMTRAQRRLYLSHSRARMIQGQRQNQSPSRFLAAIAEALLKKQQEKLDRKKDRGQMKLF
jgi:uncharacterized protein (TIGR00375 family)